MAAAERRALAMGDDDLDLIHAGIIAGCDPDGAFAGRAGAA